MLFICVVLFTVFLGIVDELEDEVVMSEYSSDSDSSSESSLGEMQYFKDKEAEQKEAELKAKLQQAEEEQEEGDRVFDMKKNMERIGCGRFYEALVAEGFVDEVGFVSMLFNSCAV